MDHEDTFRFLRAISAFVSKLAARILHSDPREGDPDRDTCGESLTRIARARR